MTEVTCQDKGNDFTMGHAVSAPVHAVVSHLSYPQLGRSNYKKLLVLLL